MKMIELPGRKDRLMKWDVPDNITHIVCGTISHFGWRVVSKHKSFGAALKKRKKLDGHFVVVRLKDTAIMDRDGSVKGFVGDWAHLV